MGGSALAQVYGAVGHDSPDLDNPAALSSFICVIQNLLEQHLLLAYHDRSDGGLLTTLLEMAFAGNVGLDIQLGSLGKDHHAVLFAEETGCSDPDSCQSLRQRHAAV